MKSITATRLITALNNINRLHIDKTSRLSAITQLNMQHGCQSIVERQASAVIAAVEVDINLLQLDMDKSNKVIGQLISKSKFFQKWRNIVFKIQSRHGISGLVEGICTLGNRTISVLIEHDTLILTETDIKLLSAEKNKVVNFFLESAYLDQHQVFLNQNRFFRCLADDVLDYAGHYQWAIANTIDEDYHELLLINGIDNDKFRTDIKWFISSNQEPN